MTKLYIATENNYAFTYFLSLLVFIQATHNTTDATVITTPKALAAPTEMITVESIQMHNAIYYQFK